MTDFLFYESVDPTAEEIEEAERADRAAKRHDRHIGDMARTLLWVIDQSPELQSMLANYGKVPT